ncbi:MAG: sel1 repeat family protein [Alphaproteobacteria bacterium]|nr:sel1 repeat family protein [Alphaproteobacteria bacterium]
MAVALCAVAVAQSAPSVKIQEWKAAAEKGDVRAQNSLGWAYFSGDGVSKDLRKAARWYREAAEQGHTEAQNFLGILYMSGLGVITNEREAYIWFSIAKATGSKIAAKNFHGENWDALLTQSEIRSARKEAAQRMEEIDRRKAGQN